MRSILKFGQRNKNSSSLVYILPGVELDIFTPSRAVMAKKCTKKRDARAEFFLLLLFNKLIDFLTFWLPSLSSFESSNHCVLINNNLRTCYSAF